MILVKPVVEDLQVFCESWHCAANPCAEAGSFTSGAAKIQLGHDPHSTENITPNMQWSGKEVFQHVFPDWHAQP